MASLQVVGRDIFRWSTLSGEDSSREAGKNISLDSCLFTTA